MPKGEKFVKHGEHKTTLFALWNNTKKLCSKNSKNHAKYYYEKGRVKGEMYEHQD